MSIIAKLKRRKKKPKRRFSFLKRRFGKILLVFEFGNTSLL